MQKINLVNLTPHEYIQLKNAISGLLDDATIGTDYAAFYLEMSEKTLANHRQKGAGPAYIQANTSEARNQSVSYKMGDLRTWQQKNRFKNPVAAADARGLCREVNDLFDDIGFWQDSDGNLIDVMTEGSANELIQSGIDAISTQMSFLDALKKYWVNSSHQKILFDHAEMVLDEWREAAKSSLESALLLSRFR